jgi:hypothetical protein
MGAAASQPRHTGHEEDPPMTPLASRPWLSDAARRRDLGPLRYVSN